MIKHVKEEIIVPIDIEATGQTSVRTAYCEVSFDPNLIGFMNEISQMKNTELFDVISISSIPDKQGRVQISATNSDKKDITISRTWLARLNFMALAKGRTKMEIAVYNMLDAKGKEITGVEAISNGDLEITEKEKYCFYLTIV
jgi:hypothetical protein